MYLRNLNAESLHFPAKLVRVAVEDDARHTGALGTFDVLSGIVDKQTFLRNKMECFVQKIVDFCTGLDQLDIGGNKRPVKILTAGNPRPVFVLAVAGVGQQIYAVSRLFQVAYQLSASQYLWQDCGRSRSRY